MTQQHRKVNGPVDKGRAVSRATREKSAVHPALAFVDNRSESPAQRVLKDRAATGPVPEKMPLQRKTKIQHTTTDFTYGQNKTDKVGLAMKAWLDPRDPVKGSQTGTPQKALYNAVKQKAKASMVRGHLLNHDLGGYGVSENLYPITSSANSKHKFHVENPVQQELKSALDATNKTKHDNNQGKGIYYTVTVGNAQTDVQGLVSNPITFDCTAKELIKVGTGSTGTESTALFSTTIVSDTQGKKSTDRGSAHKTGDASAAPDMKVTKKIIPQGWAHGSRSGTQDFLDKLKETDPKISLVNANDQTSTLSTPIDSDTVDSAIDDANANVTELRKVMSEVRGSLIRLIFSGVSLERIQSTPLVQQVMGAENTVNFKILFFNTKTFSSNTEKIAALEDIVSDAQEGMDLAGLLQTYI